MVWAKYNSKFTYTRPRKNTHKLAIVFPGRPHPVEELSVGRAARSPRQRPQQGHTVIIGTGQCEAGGETEDKDGGDD